MFDDPGKREATELLERMLAELARADLSYGALRNICLQGGMWTGAREYQRWQERAGSLRQEVLALLAVAGKPERG